MPKIIRPEQQTRETEIAAQLAEFAAGFKRSQKGNLWRFWNEARLTIFRRKVDDLFGWSITDEDGPRFSPDGYETESDAIGDLAYSLGVTEQ